MKKNRLVEIAKLLILSVTLMSFSGVSVFADGVVKMTGFDDVIKSNGDIEISVDATDVGSGINVVRLMKVGSPNVEIDKIVVTSTEQNVSGGKLTLTIAEGEGLNEYYIDATDHATNVTKSSNFSIDLCGAPPVITIDNDNSNLTEDEVVVTITAEQNSKNVVNDLKSIAVEHTDGDGNTITLPVDNGQITVTENGVIKIIIEDEYGNTEEEEFVITNIKGDSEEEQSVIEGLDGIIGADGKWIGDWTNQDVTLEVNLMEAKYSSTDGSFLGLEVKTGVTFTVVSSEEGVTSIENGNTVRFELNDVVKIAGTDSWGKVVALEIEVDKIDKVAPNAEITADNL